MQPRKFLTKTLLAARVAIGPDIHFVQEDQPTNIGNTVVKWVAGLKR